MQEQFASKNLKSRLFIFFVLSWLHMLWLTRVYLNARLNNFGADLNTLFHITAWLFYSQLYLLPSVLFAKIAYAIGGMRRAQLSLTCAFVVSTIMMILVRADGMVYDLYAFHINSFVLNLIWTPGGIASLGSGNSSFVSFGLVIAGIVAVQFLFLFISLRIPPRIQLQRRRHLMPLGLVFLCLFLIQGAVYGISDINNYGPVLNGSKAFPLFRRVRFRSLAENLGFERKHRSEFAAASGGSSLHYPRETVIFSLPATRPNIVMLVAESLRWDQLDAETMPNTWAFSQNAQRYTSHYSSGNGTREGLFGMFYGLYGSYWESFMTARQPPLLIERLQDLGYAFDVRTSATFTYPEFDKTLFATLPPASLHTADARLPAWQRDVQNTDELLEFLRTRSDEQPFFEFFFFESTHAPYTFPEARARYANYGPEMDYASLSRASLAAEIGPIHTRYRNAAHWVDMQLGRIYVELERQGLLENTIVIITGDHGEEFMEKGAWGHNSSFVEEQTHVPFVMSVPGLERGVVKDQPTSHLDIASTLLPQLGALSEPAHYTLGTSLLDTTDRKYLVISDWHSIGIMTPELKYRLPYLNISGADYWAPTDATDQPLNDEIAEAMITRYRASILEMMTNCTVFNDRDGAVEAP